MLFILSQKIGEVAELFDPSSFARVYAKFFKIPIFSSKKGPNMLFLAHLL